MIDVNKIHSKHFRRTAGKLTEVWRTPISYDSSVVSRDRCRPLPTSMMKQFLSLVAGFAFASKECFEIPSDDCFWNVKMIFLATII